MFHRCASRACGSPSSLMATTNDGRQKLLPPASKTKMQPLTGGRRQERLKKKVSSACSGILVVGAGLWLAHVALHELFLAPVCRPRNACAFVHWRGACGPDGVGFASPMPQSWAILQRTDDKNAIHTADNKNAKAHWHAPRGKPFT